jgi:catechol 2,3-dioxygenase-like lactoylglutathione lyase family enzyme
MIRGVNHATFAVRDLEESTRFYRDILGFRMVARWPRGAYFLAGSLWLAIQLDDRTRQGALPEYTHLAFDVAPEDFEACAQRIAASGAQVWQGNRSEGPSLYFLDPNGHKLEIHAGDLASRLRAARAAPWDGFEIIESKMKPMVS